MAALEPSPVLEKTVRVLNAVFGFAGIPYWLSFGGLYAIVKNRGVIPDADFDVCCLHGADWERLRRAFENRGYRMSKAIVSDLDGSALYCGYNHPQFAHVCVSFWYRSHGMRWFCHDQHKELSGVGVPPSGYYFKGVPAGDVEDELFFRQVEWPGLDGSVKVRVPLFAGRMLDCLYPWWAYQHQKYNVHNNEVQEEKLASVYHGGAVSRHMVHLSSMADWGNEELVQSELEMGERKWRAEVKKWQKSFR